MKILAYEVRDDEREHFYHFAEKYGVEVILTDQVPTLENADMAAGCEGVTMLGQGKITPQLLDRYKDLGVLCITTRTIGYDHIEVAY